MADSRGKTPGQLQTHSLDLRGKIEDVGWVQRKLSRAWSMDLRCTSQEHGRDMTPVGLVSEDLLVHCVPSERLFPPQPLMGGRKRMGRIKG